MFLYFSKGIERTITFLMLFIYQHNALYYVRSLRNDRIIVYIHKWMQCMNDNCESSVDCYYLCFNLSSAD